MTRILFVDDEIDPRQTAEPSGSYMWFYIQALRDADYEVIPVTTPDEAIQKVEEDSADFDLLILDIMMPPGNIVDAEQANGGVRSGVLLADLIATTAPKLPILVLTNVLDLREREELRKKPNVRDVLYKPYFTPFEFVNEVQGFFRGRSNV